MARITWQNVAAPDFETSRRALDSAARSFSQGFGGLGSTLQSYQDDRKDEVSQQALARLAQVTDPNALQTMLNTQGLAGLGITDPTMVNASVISDIMSRPGTLLNNQQTELTNIIKQQSIDQTNHQLAVSAFSRPHEVALENINNVADQQKYVQDNMELFNSNPNLLSSNLRSIISQGGMEAQADQNNMLNYQTGVAATALFNSVLEDPAMVGADKATRQRAINNSNASQSVKEAALRQLENMNESDYAVDPFAKASVENSGLVSGYRSRLDLQLSELGQRRAANPMFDFLEYNDPATQDASKISGAMSELVTDLQENPNNYGNAEGAVLNMVRDVAAKTGASEDMVAFLVLSGKMFDGRNWVGRRLYRGSDLVIREGDLEKSVNALLDPRQQQLANQDYIQWKRDSEEVTAKKTLAERAILEATLGMSRDTSDANVSRMQDLLTTRLVTLGFTEKEAKEAVDKTADQVQTSPEKTSAAAASALGERFLPSPDLEVSTSNTGNGDNVGNLLTQALTAINNNQEKEHGPSGLYYSEMDVNQLQIIANTGSESERAWATAELSIRKAMK